MKRRKGVSQRDKPELRKRFNAVRAAKLFRPVTNPELVVGELGRILRKPSLQSTLVRRPRLEIHHETAAHGITARIGSDAVIARSRRLLEAFNDDGIIFKISSASTITRPSVEQSNGIHCVKVDPDSITVDRVNPCAVEVEREFKTGDLPTFGGLVVATCMSPDQATYVADSLNSGIEDLQRIGILLGPLRSEAQ